MIKKLSKYIPSTLFLSFILWMIIQADLNKKNIIMDIGHAVPWGDKIGHFLLFGILALLLNVALRFHQINFIRRKFHLGSVLVLILATVEEFSQLAFSARTFEIMDMLFDLFGIGVLSSVAFRKFLVRKMQEFTNYLIKHLHVKV